MNRLSRRDFATFWNEGFVVGDIGISDELCERALTEVEGLEYEPIFGDVYRRRRDQFRRQANVDPIGDAVGEIHTLIAEMLAAIYAGWRLDRNGWHAIMSYPGGGDQAVHHDFPAFDTEEALHTRDIVQASIIIALMDDTLFHVYPCCFGSQADHSDRETLVLQRGEMVFFRGDLAHAGAAFDALNIRLHCYVLVEGIEQEEDATEAVHFRTFRCERCLALVYSRLELRDHLRVCRPGRYRCQYCNRPYTLRNSLNQHIGRHHRSQQVHRQQVVRRRGTIESEEGRQEEESAGDDNEDSGEGSADEGSDENDREDSSDYMESDGSAGDESDN